MHRARALPDLRTRREDANATLRQLERRPRRETQFTAPRESRTVVEQRDADPTPLAADRSLLLMVAGLPYRAAERLERAAIVAEDLTRRRGVAGPQRIELTHPDRVHA